MSEKSSTFASQTQNDTTMVVTPTKDQGATAMPYNPTNINLMGLTEIHETQLIDPNWKNQPMRQWDEVYDGLCREVGAAYGLNDIREA